MDAKQKAKLKRVTELVNKAGKAFKSKEFKDSAKSIKSAERIMVGIAKSGGEAAVEAMKSDFSRLSKARTMLEKQGQKFDELPDLMAIAKENAVSAESESEMVSFTKQVAPIIVEHCGKCHIQQTQGRYSAANYNDLKKGTRKGLAVKPNDVEKSRLVTLIDIGKMPPKKVGKTVPPEQLQVLKDWISQVAKFDGNSKQKKANLTEFVSMGREGSSSKGGSSKK